METHQPEIDGWVHIRPVRIGLVFKPTFESIQLAAQYATASWGGMFFPLLDSSEKKSALRLAAALDVDALYPIDDDPVSEELSRTSGYEWRGRGDWGPFGFSMGRLTTHVQGVDWIHDEKRDSPRCTLPEWEDSHPLTSLLSLWYGRYGSTDYEEQLALRFAAQASRVELQNTNTLSDYRNATTPICHTADEMSYSGKGDRAALVIINPKDPVDLIHFWNMRATGTRVFPWILGYEHLVSEALHSWLDEQIETGTLAGWMRGDGLKLGPRLYIHCPTGYEITPPLSDALLDRNITSHSLEPELRPSGWTGNHPFHTEFKRMFSVTMSRRGGFEIPLPHLGGSRWHREHQPGTVIADIHINGVINLPPEQTMVVPAHRDLAYLCGDYDETLPNVFRPTDSGRALGVSANSSSVRVGAIKSLAVFQTLLAGTNWKVQQTNGGRFSARLIESLGGSASHVANQPGIRAILSNAAASHSGRPLPALIQAARKYMGDWPSRWASEQQLKDYPIHIVRYLLSRDSIRPFMPVRCPICTAESSIRPDDLTTQLKCDLCRSEFPLGLALGLRQKNEWLYRIPDSISLNRLNETMPVMAALSVLSNYRLSPSSSPHLLGVEIEHPGGRCEIDLAIALWESFPPLMVIGEVKSYRDSITRTDLENLVVVQTHLRNKGIECYVMAATLKEELSDEAVAALKEICEDPPDALSHRVDPVLPIVLTAKNLSVPYQHDDHPMTWSEPGRMLVSVAIESCKKNLGLAEIEYKHGIEHPRWNATWKTPG